MTVEELKKKLGLTEFTHDLDLRRAVTGGYTGDLLSWVMGRAAPGCAWVTIMSNRNVAAVALMADVSCVVLAEDVRPDDDMLSRAQSEGIPVLGSAEGAFAICGKIFPHIG